MGVLSSSFWLANNVHDQLRDAFGQDGAESQPGLAGKGGMCGPVSLKTAKLSVVNNS